MNPHIKRMGVRNARSSCAGGVISRKEKVRKSKLQRLINALTVARRTLSSSAL
jgi:hypothetical protein